ncbi:MAG: efflux RND transporter periplasmic adaptor subunit [Planctomycetota bacterium]|jgi:multidrug resistance efflux pump
MASTSGSPVDLNKLRIDDSSSPSRSRVGVVLLVVLLPVAFVGGWLVRGSGGGTIAGPVIVRTETVRAGTARSSRTDGFGEGGWIEVPSYHPIVVSALVPGRVDELLVLEGSRVAKGQVVARLYGKDLERDFRRAEAEVGEAGARLALLRAGYRKEEVAKARVDVARLEEEVKLAEKVLARTRELVPTGAASREDLDRHASALEVARAHVEAAREELGRLEAGFRVEEVKQAEATLARTEAARDLAEARLSYTDVKSPAAGVVMERYVTPGTWLTAADPRVVAVYDPEDLQVRVDVRQTNRTQVFVGQKVKISTEAEPGRTYPGEVIRVEPVADFKKNTIQAKIRILEPSESLHPEMICRVRFAAAVSEVASEGDPVITVPAGAIVREGRKSLVFLVRDGRARRTEIRTGAETGGRLAVEAGLSKGDRVVLEPAGLADGDPVQENR